MIQYSYDPPFAWKKTNSNLSFSHRFQSSRNKADESELNQDKFVAKDKVVYRERCSFIHTADK